jgi:hypothetical protein
MKVLIYLLLISLPTFAQPYFGIGLQNKGFNMCTGILADKIDAQINFKTPLTSAEESKQLSATIGRMILVSQNDDNNYSFTPSVGMAWLKSTDFTEYDLNPNKGPVDVIKFKAVYALEIGKDAHIGRISLTARYVDRLYWGVNMRVFFGR